MINQLGVDGLDASLENEDLYDLDYSIIIEFQHLTNIFEALNLVIPENVIYLIHLFCKPGIAYIHTRDGGEFAISLRALRLSKLLSIQAELKPFEPIHLRKCSAHTFSHVANYLAHHRGVEPAEIRKPIISVSMIRIVEDEWDAHFANSLTKREVFEITLVANYIDCESLLHLMCSKVATLMKGKSTEELRVILYEQDAIAADYMMEQQQKKLRSICMCGYVWGEDLEELKNAETDEGKSQEVEEIILDDDGQGQE